MFPEPVGQFYLAPMKTKGRKHGKNLLEHIKGQATAISQPSSKAFKVGKCSKGNHLADFPLLDALYDPRFNQALLEDLNVNDVDL